MDKPLIVDCFFSSSSSSFFVLIVDSVPVGVAFVKEDEEDDGNAQTVNPSNVPPFFCINCWTSARSDKNRSHTLATVASEEGNVIEIVFESSSEANLQWTTVTLSSPIFSFCFLESVCRESNVFF